MNKQAKTIKRFAGRAALTLLLAVLATATAWADNNDPIISGYTATSGTSGYSGENYDKLVDDDPRTKWCVNGSSCNIEFETASAFVPTGYVMTTASDNNNNLGRRPKNWTIKAKANSGDSWTTIATVTNNSDVDSRNCRDTKFTLDNSMAYCFFRLEITAVQSGDKFQLAEFRFKGHNATVTNKQYIKDVMLIGGDQSTVNSLKSTYQSQGWTVLNYNLNEGVGGDYIYLLYKYDTSKAANFSYISELYLRKGDNPPDELTYDSRKFYHVAYDGSSDFQTHKANLNNGVSGSDQIHLYYTKSTFNSTYLSTLSVNTTQSGAIGQDGGSTGYSLNAGKGSAIYLHATTATANTYTVNIAPGIGLNDASSRYDSDNTSCIAASKSAAQNCQFYNDNGNIGFKLSASYNPYSSNHKDGYTFLGWDTDNTADHLLSETQTMFTAQWLGWLHDGATITGVKCSDYSTTSITTATIPATIDGTTITAINITDNLYTIQWSLPKLQKLYTSTVTNVSGTPFAACVHLTDLYFTNTTTPMSFADGSLAGLNNRLNVWCYTPMPAGFRPQVYERSPNLLLVFTDALCGWCGDTGTQNGLYWTMKNDDITIDCCDNRYETYPNAQTVNSHTWSYGYAGMPKKVHLSHAVKGIGAETFKDNANLAELYYEGTKAEWDAVTKGSNWKSGVASNFKEYWRCTVSFNANGRGTNPQAQTKIWRDIDKAAKPALSINEGYEVAGWYTEAACTTRWDFNTAIAADMTLYANWTKSIHDTSDNNLTAWDDKMRDATLDGRILYMDDDWNTLCLPFSLSSFAGTPLAGFTVMELDTDAGTYEHKTGFDDGTLYLNFKNATSIEAGKPYIVKKKGTTNITYNLISASEGSQHAEDLFDDDGWSYNWDITNVPRPWIVEFSTSSPIWTIGYAMTITIISNDPHIWTLQAKVNEGDEWVIIDSQDQYRFKREGSAINYTNYFSIDPSKRGFYKYFRLVIEHTYESYNYHEDDYKFYLEKLSILYSDVITNPLFQDVTINADEPTAVTSDDGKVSFVGSYNPVDLTANDKSVLYLGDGNTLYWPSTAKTIGSCRAYFQLNNGLTAGDPAPTGGGDQGGQLVRAFNLNFDEEEETTGFFSATLNDKGQMINDKWYTIDGRKLSGKPTKKGLYINNGKKVVIK